MWRCELKMCIYEFCQNLKLIESNSFKKAHKSKYDNNEILILENHIREIFIYIFRLKFLCLKIL